jgi:hypothetical protein
VPDAREVVAVQRDVEGAERQVGALVTRDRVMQPRGDQVAARADTDEGEGPGVSIALDDLMRDAGDGPADVVGGQDGRQVRTPFPASQDRSLKVDACTVSICVSSSRSSP